MPLFQITRQMPGWTEEEIEAGGVRTQLCVGWFEGLRWIRSFQDPQREMFTCYYESPDAETIRRHSLISEVPANEIHEVREWLPDDEVAAPTSAPSSDGAPTPALAPAEARR